MTEVLICEGSLYLCSVNGKSPLKQKTRMLLVIYNGSNFEMKMIWQTKVIQI